LGDLKLAWLWLEGRRAELRKGGDIVEKSRWEWRLDDRLRGQNRIPVIVATVPGGLAAKGKGGEGATKGRRKKSVHWA
ncbi:hypothetical protein QBC46DRAFT_275019, partial [Diplogelasinospora grovesii]